MSKLNINIENHEQKYTVSEMRKRLAQVLSKLNGDQPATFSFRAELTDYTPAPECQQILELPVICGAYLGRQGPCGLQAGHVGDHVRRILAGRDAAR